MAARLRKIYWTGLIAYTVLLTPATSEAQTLVRDGNSYQSGGGACGCYANWGAGGYPGVWEQARTFNYEARSWDKPPVFDYSAKSWEHPPTFDYSARSWDAPSTVNYLPYFGPTYVPACGAK